MKNTKQFTGVPMIELHNGVQMPQLGLGVWEAENGDEVERAVKTALDAGYRLIDTAKIYGNEEGVGRAIRDSGLHREDIFVTTKLWNQDQGFDSALRAYDESLKRLGLDYIDLYLIHWPVPDRGEFKNAWRALEKLYNEHRVHAIGVSNFKPHHLRELEETWQLPPMVNQIELHPYMQQIETREFCEEHDIAVEAYSPLQRASELLHDQTIEELADKYEKSSPAQIVLRWHMQEGLIAIPKSVTPSRIRQNIDIFDFEMHPDDIELVRELNRDEKLLDDPDDKRR